ncbi:MAG TPA: YciI family protein, partial [Longimicrobiaceae bacterium]|nr:YciI family protein [Longimicrobiaceae bacterium]
MRYLLMMHVPMETGGYAHERWSPEDWKAHIAFLQQYNRELKEAGEWVDVMGLQPPGQAKLVRAGKRGAPPTDGPFPETKEFLAGFWIVDIESPERAYELAAKASMAPGEGGEPLYMPIEVREVMGGPPKDA